MNTFILALQLMTRLPVNKEIEVTDQRLVRGVVYWPLVGVITGIIDCAVFVILSFFLPKSVAVAGGILCQLLVTGGFHLDGLCDTADALFSARSRERMLEIMKDSRVGTNGVIAAIFDIGLKVMILSRLAHPVMAFLLTPVAGKCVQGVLMYKAVYPRKSGLGASYIGKIGWPVMAGCLFCGVVIIEFGLFLEGHSWLMMCPVVFTVLALAYRFYVEKKIGGMTGDTMGAGNEITEVVFLLCLIIGQRFGI
ncbi:adenosylcobinamide-GDP ribazoletransferase [Catenibacillus scindens]|uniref:Adenosylcobinamide-GDP ribazoletransferase n=1 Tax=Catenibacillus scindens TaxID=673271 RepID=A0A7W8HDT7_9FIRM|nr:adenosylcobinamide-GDP ribazoletransferase [Catenibacillus scindens]MBB5265865.1 adenosylcobinamide-GDP ribazoletransferase [Catenibacillus scindens]